MKYKYLVKEFSYYNEKDLENFLNKKSSENWDLFSLVKLKNVECHKSDDYICLILTFKQEDNPNG